LAQRKLKLLEQHELRDRVRVVLNEAHNPSELPRRELERLLGVEVFLSLPNDRYSVENASRLAKFVPSNCLLGRRYDELAASLLRRPARSGEAKSGLLSYLRVGGTRSDTRPGFDPSNSMNRPVPTELQVFTAGS